MSTSARTTAGRLTPDAALALLATQSMPRYRQVLAHGSLSIEVYRPLGHDTQQPHRQDEVYVVISGHGIFDDGGRRQPFAPGEVLFVPAGRAHRFEDFSEDFATWVFLYGPEGGEQPSAGNASPLPAEGGFLLPPAATPSLPILGSAQRFPLRRVFCIGRNYAEHAREMGATVDKGAPLFFCKPPDAVVSDGGDVRYPQATSELHHEVEMVVALGAGGRDLDPARAGALIFGYGVGLDLTRRDLQAQAKAKGHPWDVAKAFDDSAPVSALRSASEVQPHADTELQLRVNGELRQHTRLGEMIHDVPDIIAALSRLFELKAGDLIFTGTPAGVAALQRGDRFEAELHGIATLSGMVV